MRIFVTGGAGFIGSAFVRYIINQTENSVVVLDKLTYAGNLYSLAEVSLSYNNRLLFEQVDICDSIKISKLFQQYVPDAVMHLAAESHVDRSIENASEFIQTNILGTYTLLEEAKKYWQSLNETKKTTFRFLHVSTDEVYGALESEDSAPFTEATAYQPNSPYSSSKASSNHLVRAWHKTYGFPALITNCSNNYGPYQFPEKLIPLTILNILQNKPIPVYGDGKQIRDWLYIDDHIKALYLVLTQGEIGSTYNIAGENEHQNIEVVKLICQLLDELLLNKSFSKTHSEDLIHYVPDRLGHDFRYAIDVSNIKETLGWRPEESFESGMLKTIKWYLENQEWWCKILDGTYQNKTTL